VRVILSLHIDRTVVARVTIFALAVPGTRAMRALFSLLGGTLVVRALFSFSSLLCAILSVGVLALIALPTPAEELTREQQIAEIEKQIAELQKKIAGLKGTPVPPTAAPAEGAEPAWVKALSWRAIGPATMAGRITSIAAFEADPTTYWIATASGGLLKTTNAGNTFEHQFDKEATVSIGDVAVAPSNRDLVWVGTGENNPRNSVSYGDGVYKSTDGGKHWKNMGLKKTFQIGKILIHPKDPNTVYVGALGRLYGPSPDRGLYKTTNAGETWEKVLYVDDRTGVIDMVLNPANPEELIVATWERLRDEFDSHPGSEVPIKDGYDGYDPSKKWGPGSGLHKTSDGGKTWKKLTKGLPSNPLGRIGLDIYRKDPKTLFAIIDCEKIGMGTPPVQVFLGVQSDNAESGFKVAALTKDGPAEKAGLKTGDVIKAVDKKEIKTSQDLGTEIGSRKPGDKVTLTVLRDKETKEIVATLEQRPGDVGPGGQPNVTLGFFAQEQEDLLLVQRVQPDSSADKAGIKEGDTVKAVNKKEVKTRQDVAQALSGLKAGDKATVTIQRGTETKDYAIEVEARRGPGGRGGSQTRPFMAIYGGQAENNQNRQGPDSHEYGGIYKSTDGGDSWVRINSLNPRPMYFSLVRVDPSDDKYLYVGGVSLYRSSDGGKSFKPDGGNGVHPDNHALWIDPRDGRHMILGTDGGFYCTRDRMDHWDHLNTAAIGQFYHCCVDTRRPYRVYGGLQDNGSWGGPSMTLSQRGPINEDWVSVNGGDGFVCRVDPNDPDLVYYESQDGRIGRRNLRTGEQTFFQFGRRGRGEGAYRFNWNTPFILSNANPRIFYCAGQFVFRSLTQGTSLKVISPEITRTKRGSATALSESPRNPDVLYAGTDDGFLWVTKDGGVNWTNLTENLLKAKDAPAGHRWVSTIEASRFADGRCYVVLDAHRSDDDNPYVFVTEDFGQTWKSLKANLPWGSTRVLREDIETGSLLYLGTEFGLWASIDRGSEWVKINNNNLPTVAVHEVAIHPTAGEIVAATHGRSLWVLDVTMLRQITSSRLKEDAYLFRPNTAMRWRRELDKGSPYGNGSRSFAGQNPPVGAQIFYSLGKKAEKVSLKIQDYSGRTLREVPVKSEPGIHKATWNLTQLALRPGLSQYSVSGTYRVVLTVDGKEYVQGLRVEVDPVLQQANIAEIAEPWVEKWIDD
jgi:photosystem II stability/assembly factor-like uncharacterized protein